MPSSDLIKIDILKGDNDYFTSYRTSVDTNLNQSSVQFNEGVINNQFSIGNLSI